MIGNRLVKCLECREEFICGDCIKSICPACECAKHGHIEVAGMCGRCGERLVLPDEFKIGKPTTPRFKPKGATTPKHPR